MPEYKQKDNSFKLWKNKYKEEGDKKPDTLEAIFGMQDDIDQNYEIKFLQDIVDTSYL